MTRPTPYYDDGKGITLYCGDCLTILPELPQPDMWLLDLPYGIGLNNHAAGKERSNTDWTVVGDECQTFGTEVLHRLEGPVVAFASPMKPWPGKWRQHLIWNKGPAVGGGGDVATCWKQSFELIQIRDTPTLNGNRDEAVLNFGVTPTNSILHACAKPASLLRYLIGKTTQPGGLVIDPTCGSGSTLVAAKLEGRRAVGIELNENYARLTVERLRQGVLFSGESGE